jgi:hypothetical protein
MKPYYVILTGSKNNAGDFLIKYRAKQLFSQLRTDRDIVDFDAWKKFTPENLEIINGAKALILMGGPALQYEMYPKIYALTDSLADIKVPIITMGIGYKDLSGTWERTSSYELTQPSISLLNKIAENEYSSSVRDYHTLNVLLSKGYSNFKMTGCPALYDLDFIQKPFQINRDFKNICFSLGVSYMQNEGMNTLMRDCILRIKKYFSKSNFTLMFHHKIDESKPKQKEMILWLRDNQVDYIDISGSSDLLVKNYSNADFHIGFRVHAHIFMSSISKPSILLNEDSRGKALYHVVNGLIFDAYDTKKLHLIERIKTKISGVSDFYAANFSVLNDIENNIQYEIDNQFPRMSATRVMIDHHYQQMVLFLKQLP